MTSLHTEFASFLKLNYQLDKMTLQRDAAEIGNVSFKFLRWNGNFAVSSSISQRERQSHFLCLWDWSGSVRGSKCGIDEREVRDVYPCARGMRFQLQFLDLIWLKCKMQPHKYRARLKSGPLVLWILFLLLLTTSACRCLQNLRNLGSHFSQAL